jgi:transposase-like protein
MGPTVLFDWGKWWIQRQSADDAEPEELEEPEEPDELDESLEPDDDPDSPDELVDDERLLLPERDDLLSVL